MVLPACPAVMLAHEDEWSKYLLEARPALTGWSTQSW